MPHAHALISPSGAERIARCPGSVNATKDLPRRSNEAASEGTILHDITADCLQFGFDPYDYVNQDFEHEGFKFTIDDDQAEVMCIGVDWAREQPGQLFVETRVDLSAWPPFEFGTLDVALVSEEEICLVDHKYGYIPVDAESNKQVAIYAMGFWEQVARHITKATKFRLIINQPRRIGPKWRVWEVELADLREFMGDIQEAVAKAEDPDAPRFAGQVQCQYCARNPAMGGPGCDTLDTYMLDLLGLTRDDLDDAALIGDFDMPDLVTLTPEQQATIWKHRTMIAKWIDGVTRLGLESALKGEPPPGLAAYKKFGDREYTDSEKAQEILVEVLADDAFNMKLKSPAQAEKLLKPGKRKRGNPDAWEKLNALITKPETGFELGLATDERPAFVNVDTQFDEEEE